MISAPSRDEAVPNPSGVCFDHLDRESLLLIVNNISNTGIRKLPYSPHRSILLTPKSLLPGGA